MTDILKDFNEMKMLPNIQERDMPIFFNRLCNFINKNSISGYRVVLNYGDLLDNCLFVEEFKKNPLFAFETIKALESNTKTLLREKKWCLSDEHKVRDSKKKLYKVLCQFLDYNNMQVLIYFANTQEEILAKIYKDLRYQSVDMHQRERALLEHLYVGVPTSQENLSNLLCLLHLNKDLCNELSFKKTINYFARYDSAQSIRLESLLQLLLQTPISVADVRQCTQEDINTLLSVVQNSSEGRYYREQFVLDFLSHSSFQNKLYWHFMDNIYSKALHYTNVTLRSPKFIEYCKTSKKAAQIVHSIFNKEVYNSDIINFLGEHRLTDLAISEDTVQCLIKAKYKIEAENWDIQDLEIQLENGPLGNLIFRENIHYIYVKQENMKLKNTIAPEKNKEIKNKGFKL